MTSSRIMRPATAFALSNTQRKRGRQFRESHLDYIRQLPCLVCGSGAPNEAAHIRYGSLPHGKPSSGLGEKPSDQWCVPLCAKDHRIGTDAQHNTGEREWWDYRGIDPLIIAALLFASSGDVEAGESIIRSWKWRP